jgi:hypothetical protein
LHISEFEINFTKLEDNWSDKDYDLFVKKIFSLNEVKLIKYKFFIHKDNKMKPALFYI